MVYVNYIHPPPLNPKPVQLSQTYVTFSLYGQRMYSVGMNEALHIYLHFYILSCLFTLRNVFPSSLFISNGIFFRLQIQWAGGVSTFCQPNVN